VSKGFPKSDNIAIVEWDKALQVIKYEEGMKVLMKPTEQ